MSLKEENENQNNVVDMNKFRNNKVDTVEQKIASEEKIFTPTELQEELDDVYLMGKQDAVYQMVAQFLSTPEAVKGNIVGVRVVIEDGYVNCYWEFGNREGGLNGR